MSLPPKIPTCSDCGRTFKKTAHLTQHVKRIHQGGVKVVCDICGKVLAKRSLGDHLNSHNNVRRYQCSYCGKSFVRECTYQEHVRIHTGEKPYECNLCGRKFTQNSGLKAHLVSHERVGDKARTTDWRMKERKSKPGEEERMQDFPVSLEQDPVQPDQVHCAVRNWSSSVTLAWCILFVINLLSTITVPYIIQFNFLYFNFLFNFYGLSTESCKAIIRERDVSDRQEPRITLRFNFIFIILLFLPTSLMRM